MTLTHVVEYLAFKVASGIVQLLPLRVVQRTGAALGELMYGTFGLRKAVTLENLGYAFPGKSAEELDRIARDSFRSVGTAFFELLWFPRLTETSLRSLFVYENPELIHDLLARGKGVIVVAAHFGNWELTALAFSVYAGMPLNVIAKTQSNKLVNASIAKSRTRFGNVLIPMGISVRDIIRAVEQGKAVGILPDQTAPKESIQIDFFGRPVPTHQGPAVFSLKMGAPLLVTFPARQTNGSYKGRFVQIRTDDLADYSEENIVELTKRHVKATEDAIRANPDQWMWMHRRWKHVTPKAEPAEGRVKG
ncbi:MAG: lysophospholipid acyltransferase family protein [Bacteroidota bacterium]